MSSNVTVKFVGGPEKLQGTFQTFPYYPAIFVDEEKRQLQRDVAQLQRSVTNADAAFNVESARRQAAEASARTTEARSALAIKVLSGQPIP